MAYGKFTGITDAEWRLEGQHAYEVSEGNPGGSYTGEWDQTLASHFFFVQTYHALWSLGSERKDSLQIWYCW